ncbi:MAG: Ig domain-containing protein, partial [Candidatus Micrarchaeota archaeon]|nr:Ig domain-containing protein [Candidatus Micrarchaeota archaeon]
MVTNPRAKKGQGAIERSGAARPLKGQGATEYLIIFAAALIIALAAISYLGYQASNSSELTLSDSKLYWQSTARPLQVHDASSVYGELCSQQDMGGYQFLVKNYDPYELTVTGIYIDGVSRDFCFSGRQSSSVLPFTHLSSHLITVPIASGVLPCEEGKMVRIDISFNYRKDNALPQVENGTKPVMFACMNFSAQNDSRLAILFNVTNVTVVPANNSSIVTPPENLSIVTTSIPNSTSGSAYSYFMQATGGSGSYVWSVEGGSLPDGLSLDWPTGEIAGTPDSISCPAPLPGHISTGCIATYRVTIQVSDRDVDGNILQTTQRNFTITNRLQYALTIDQDTLPYALAGSNYSTGLSATGGVAPYSWGVSGLPASLLANSSTGAISGMVDNLSSCLSTLIYTHANNTTALMCAENSSLAITATDSQGGIARKNLTLTRLSPITTFGSCLNITAPGYYALSSDISTSATCIVISAANVTLNCASHSIIGDNTPNSYGIYSNQYNTIVRNCIIRDFEADVFFDTGADSGLIDDTITSATLNEGWNYPGTGILIQGES